MPSTPTEIARSLTHDQRLVINEMDGFLGYSAKRIANATGLSIKAVRAAHHHFHANGLAEFGPLFDDDDGSLRGRGYWLNGEGLAVRDALAREGAE